MSQELMILLNFFFVKKKKIKNQIKEAGILISLMDLEMTSSRI
jgi:hypothetical protein